MSYSLEVRKILPPELKRHFLKLKSPAAIQDYIDSLPVNFELSGETNHSPINVFEKNVAHCFEGAVFAAAVLALHGQRPLLMDFATTYDDEDHTIALFQKNGHWGAISKTNHTTLKYRDPVYRSPRELAMSYFNEYYMYDGRKSMRAYSAPFDLTRYRPEIWITSRDSLDWLMLKISVTRYHSVAPDATMRRLRPASNIEKTTLQAIEFPDPRDPKLTNGF